MSQIIFIALIVIFTSLILFALQSHHLIVIFSSNGCTCISSLQLCGNNPHVMTRCAQMLEETTHIDFIDINLGCPIELVYQQVQYSFS